MLTAEIKVNGALAGVVFIRNIKRAREPNAFFYNAEYYEPENGVVSASKIWHDQMDGALILVEKAMRALVKEVKKEEWGES